MQPGISATTGVAHLTFTVLGDTHVQAFHIDGGDTVIALVGAEPAKDACDRYTPATR